MSQQPAKGDRLAHEGRLGRELVEAGHIDQARLDAALATLRERSGQTLQKILTDDGSVPHAVFADIFASRHGMQRFEIDATSISSEVTQLVPYSICTQHTLLPLGLENDVIQVAIADPMDYIPVEQALQEELGLGVRIFLATEREIRAGLRALYRDECVVDKIEFLGHGADPEETREAEAADIEQGESAVGSVNTILAQGIARGASDIHIDPDERAVRVRLRVDGVMADLATLPPALLPPLVARIKVVSGLDIGERRLPQDGAIQLKAMGRRVDLRVSTLPNVHGERVVMRILDASSGPGTLEDIGFEAPVLETLRTCLDASHGIILVTGPTGSGKSSTLYAALRYLNRPENNILTVEDPVEYRVQGISQTQTHSKIGFDFARVLEAFLRQDPDIILLGEIRNEETAEIATRASLTGHRVLSTLHVQSATEAITRMVEMGVPSYVLGSTLKAVVAQRLVRRLCRHCKVPDSIDGEKIAAWGADPSKAKMGPGCDKCGYAGYKGRLAITELFTVTPAVRDAILEGLPVRDIEAIAVESGMRLLGHSALDKVQAGLTSVSEVIAYLHDLPQVPQGSSSDAAA